jgi:hypothetical protein
LDLDGRKQQVCMNFLFKLNLKKCVEPPGDIL